MAKQPPPPLKPTNPTFTIETTMGTMKGQLFKDEAPVSVANFAKYVKEKFYEGLVFHRVIKGFVIQGGGVDVRGRPKRGGAPIKLEVTPKLAHWEGALSMARTMDPNSATSQFYVCHGPQPMLDQQYAVFGIVTEGKDVVDKIAGVRTDAADVPRDDVLIQSVTVQGV